MAHPLAKTWRRIGALLLVLGTALSPLRATAVTVPLLVAHGATAVPSTTTQIKRGGTVRRWLEEPRETAHEDARLGCDGRSNLRVSAGAGLLRNAAQWSFHAEQAISGYGRGLVAAGVNGAISLATSLATAQLPPGIDAITFNLRGLGAHAQASVTAALAPSGNVNNQHYIFAMEVEPAVEMLAGGVGMLGTARGLGAARAGWNVVYRGLAAGEDAAAGLVARAAGATNTPLSHVAGQRRGERRWVTWSWLHGDCGTYEGARAAHLETLRWQGIPNGAGYESRLYHPSVIRALSETFNPAAWPK